MYPYFAFVAGVAVLLAFCYLIIKKAVCGSRNKLLPSPPSIPLLGHLHLLGRLPHRSLCELQVRYGTDGCLLLLQLGRRRTLVVSTAAAAEDLYKNHDLAFASRVPNATVDKLSIGSNNVSFAPYGDAWRRSKKWPWSTYFPRAAPTHSAPCAPPRQPPSSREPAALRRRVRPWS
ncbi:hypothetical protein ACQ4PT_060260 [Festuca glaucescens]